MKKTVINLQSIRETAVKLATDFCLLSRRILRYANLGTPRADFLREVSRMLLKFSHCDGIELRMRDGDLFYRWEATDGEGESERALSIAVRRRRWGAGRWVCARSSAPAHHR